MTGRGVAALTGCRLGSGGVGGAAASVPRALVPVGGGEAAGRCFGCRDSCESRVLGSGAEGLRHPRVCSSMYPVCVLPGVWFWWFLLFHLFIF